MDGAIFNRDMLLLARERRGYTQSYVAGELHVAPSLISKFESGVVTPTAQNIDRLADILRCPVAFFFQTDAVYGLGCSFLFHRQRKTMSVPEQRRLIATLNVLRMQIARLLRGTELESENSFNPMDVGQFDKDGPERIARLVRAAWKLPPGPVSSVVGAIESAGGIVIRYPFKNHKASGMSWWLPELPPLIFVNSDMPGDHQRFTLMHEVGHVIMHRIPSEQIEDEANSFASEFLTPSAEIKADLNNLTFERAASLKPYWKVAMQMLIMRAKNLGCIKLDRYRRLFTELSAAGYRRAEPLPIAPEEPTLLRQLVEFHMDEHGYTIEQLANMALMRDQSEFCNQFVPDPSRQIRAAMWL